MAGALLARSVLAMYACAACGKVLGTYEPLVWVRAGSVVNGSLISLKAHSGFDPATARLLHADCADSQQRAG